MSHTASVDSKLCLANVIKIILLDEKHFFPIPNTKVDADWQFESVAVINNGCTLSFLQKPLFQATFADLSSFYADSKLYNIIKTKYEYIRQRMAADKYTQLIIQRQRR